MGAREAGPAGAADAVTAAPVVSVVTAVYRNADTIEELLARVSAVLDGASIPFEMTFVDDACPAGSGAVLARIGVAEPRVRVVTNPARRGQDLSLLAGLGCCVCRLAVLMDADLQDPPEAIPTLLQRLEDGGSDVIFAGRRGAYESAGRLATSFLYKRLMALLTDLPPDAGLFVALNRHAIDAVVGRQRAGPWLLPRLGTSGLRLATVPVERAPRPRGCSAFGSWGRLVKGVSSLAWAVACRLQRGQPR